MLSMQEFVLQRNIDRYQERLAGDPDEDERRMLARLLIEAERALAVLQSDDSGVLEKPRPVQLPPAANLYLAQFEKEHAYAGKLYLVLDPGPGLRILAASEAYAAGTMTDRKDLRGRRLFEVFPDNPGDPSADGVANLHASLRTAAQTLTPHEMPIQRYDVRGPDGAFVERYWRPVNSPILDDDGNVVALLHHVEDVTARPL